MIRMPRRWGMMMMGVAGLFGMRTPPDPEVTAQMQPAKGPESSWPPRGEAEGRSRDVSVDLESKPMRRLGKKAKSSGEV